MPIFEITPLHVFHRPVMRYTADAKKSDLPLECITDIRKVGKCIDGFMINCLWDLVLPGIHIASNLFLISLPKIYEN